MCCQTFVYFRRNCSFRVVVVVVGFDAILERLSGEGESSNKKMVSD